MRKAHNVTGQLGGAIGRSDNKCRICLDDNKRSHGSCFEDLIERTREGGLRQFSLSLIHRDMDLSIDVCVGA